MQPRAVIIAGVNGAGKTTLARRLLPKVYPDVEFLNADDIRLESPPFAHPLAAGRELLRRLEVRQRTGASFMIETTLSSPAFIRRMRSWRASGYRLFLHFIQVPSAGFAVRRVAERVARGGHHVPEADIRRRFGRGPLFFEAAKPLVDEWYHWFAETGGLHVAEYERK